MSYLHSSLDISMHDHEARVRVSWHEIESKQKSMSHPVVHLGVIKISITISGTHMHTLTQNVSAHTYTNISDPVFLCSKHRRIIGGGDTIISWTCQGASMAGHYNLPRCRN